MLTPQDDLIGHQLPTTFDQIDNSDPAWMERLWYTGHPAPHEPGRELMFDLGLGYHPNRNVMDAFAGVAVPGRQWNFRRAAPAARPLNTPSAAAPALEGLRRHRWPADNESGIRFEIEFHATMNPHERRRTNAAATDVTETWRAQQLGRYTGWLEYTATHDVDLAGQRDLRGRARRNAH
jgi:hypothetical protein